MKISAPTVSLAMKSLLKADFLVQWRQKRSPLMATMLALVILITWKNLAHDSDSRFILVGTCITIVLLGMGFMGYPGIVARDREKGIFQRLRVTPAPLWTFMTSRLIVQSVIIALSTGIVLLFAALINKFYLSVTGYFVTIIAAIICGFVFLSIGQVLVAFIRSPDTLNSTGRILYFPLAFGGALAEMNYLGSTTKAIIDWSPYGTTQTVLKTAMSLSHPDAYFFIALAMTILYAFVFAVIGIKWFKWNN